MECDTKKENLMRRTPLTNRHEEMQARMVDFEGWLMPVMYAGILQEARAVRNHAGMFDISHMGRVYFEGEGATEFLQSLTSNDAASLKPSEAQYSLLTNPQGGIIDDIIVYREAEESYLIVINAGNAAKDIHWFKTHLPDSVQFTDLSEETAMIAVQGPKAPEIVALISSQPALQELKRFQYSTGNLFSSKATFCRTGYTGEDGFEIIIPAESAVKVWDELLNYEVFACGLGARDALRIEAGYPLYGHEIDDTTSPVEALLMWVVKLDKGPFSGSDEIAKVKKTGAARRLMGLVSTERIQPRQGYNIFEINSDRKIGVITSGVFSPTRERSIAMGYIETDMAVSGMKVEIAIRDKRIIADVVPKKSLLTV